MGRPSGLSGVSWAGLQRWFLVKSPRVTGGCFWWGETGRSRFPRDWAAESTRAKGVAHEEELQLLCF